MKSERKTLREICIKIGSGATPKGGKEAYCSEGISIVRSQNVLDLQFSEAGLAFINDDQAKKLSNVEVLAGDVLLNITGDSVARCCKMNPDYLPARVNQHVCIIRGNPKYVLNDYLLYFLQFNKAYLLQLASAGATRNALTKGMIESLNIQLPSLDNQEKIISVLNALQNKISLNQKINDDLEQQAQALYANLITSNDCRMVRLEDIASKIAMGPFGSNIKVSTFVPEGVPIISGNHLRSFFLEEPSYNYITEKHAEKLKNSIVHPGDIVFTHAGNIGQVAMIPHGCDYPYYVISQRQFYMRCDKEKVIPEIVLFFFHSVEGRGKLLANANSTGVPSIAQPSTHLKNIEMPLPDKNRQDEWYKAVKPIVQQYVSLTHENKKLASLRDSLLPKLMSGELDVEGIER